VCRQLDRSEGKVLDGCACLPSEFRTEEHGAGLSRGFEAESGGEFEKIRQSRAEPGDVRKGLREQSDIVSAPSDSDADDLAFSSDREQIDRGGFGHEPLGDHANGGGEASESVADGTA
jgi:hypothetical protein